MTNVATRSTALARPLHVLVPLIQQDIEEGNHAAESAAMPYWLAAGQKLNEARTHLSLSELYSWSARNFNISRSTTTRYMEMADATPDSSRRREIPSQRELMRKLHPDQPSWQQQTVRPQPWHKPIKETLGRVNVDRLNRPPVDTELLNRREASLAQAKERDEQRKLALQLIDIGYKALASKLHPDKGGSRDAMVRLNTVRERLKASA